MARTRSAPDDGVKPTPEEAEAAAMDHVHAPEVRADEFTRGTAEPVWASPLPDEVVEALRQPLDPNRIRSRRGRGGGSFEYLAGHDVKRRANEIFGFGNWGYKVLELKETAAVQVQSDRGAEGWHVSYSALVEVLVRGCLPCSDVGYGDGVEYGPAALAQARELATKEAATDAIKRAFTPWGDQFGLILYAKDDERHRIARDEAAQKSQPVTRKVEGPPAPRTWAESINRFAGLLGVPYAEDEAKEWLRQAIEAKYGKQSIRELSAGDGKAAAIYFQSTVLALEESSADFEFGSGIRQTIRDVFKDKWHGVALEGPAWRLDPTETDRPPHPSEGGDGSAEDIEFGGDPEPAAAEASGAPS